MAISFPIQFSGNQTVGATTVAKAYSAPVAAGDVLVAFVNAYNTTETCSGVSDSANGAWTKAFGPVISGNGAMYGFYKLNAAAGTPTVTAAFSSTNHHEITISRISGLSGGGAFDQYAAQSANSTVNPNSGNTTTLGAAVCAAVGGNYNSGVVPTAYGSGWTGDANLVLWGNSQFLTQVTASNAAINASWTAGGSHWAAGVMVFKDASGGTDANAPGGTGTSTGSGSGGMATGGASGAGSFQSKPLANNTGAAGVRATTDVYWEWRIGVGVGTAPTNVIYGSGTTDSSGRLNLSGLPLGNGMLQIETTDRAHIFTQRGTVA